MKKINLAVVTFMIVAMAATLLPASAMAGPRKHKKAKKAAAASTAAAPAAPAKATS